MDPISTLLLVPALGVTAAALAAIVLVRAEPHRRAPAARRSRREIREIAERALADEDPGVRLAGARYLGRGDVLAELAQARWVETSVRVAALGTVDATRDRRAALAAVSGGLRADLLPVRVAAARLAERLRDMGALPALSAALQDLVPRWADRDDEVLAETVALARAFARLHGPPVEYALLRLVEAPARDARAVALAGLARIGTRRALPALQSATRTADPALRDAARTALAAVRFRTGDARGGAVSLAQPAAGAGALSLA